MVDLSRGADVMVSVLAFIFSQPHAHRNTCRPDVEREVVVRGSGCGTLEFESKIK